MTRVVIKLGSSIVADEGGSLRGEVLARICETVAREHARGEEVVIVSSGAIALGVRVMGLAARPAPIPELQAASAVGQGGLYRTYHEELRARGVRTGQVLLSIGDLAARAGFLNARHALAKLLEWRVVPVVNENDTTATDEISFGDNDFLAAHIALLVGAETLVLLTDIDGLYSADPRLDPEAQLVSEVHDFESLRELEIGATTSPLGSGGMRSKVLAADMATAAGTTTIVCNGLRVGVLEAALAGQAAGTRFAPRAGGHSAFKLWLRYAKPTRGTLVVDRGAAHALREAHTSLLPVGVVAVLGDFDAGDAIEIAVEGEDKEGAGLVLAKGIADYSSAELARVKGLKSAAVRELLPHASEEAVHRDRLVML
jgi:glutamate 5-kinase